MNALAVPCPVPRPTDPIARVRGLASITLRRPDPARAVRFFEDFGLHRVSGTPDVLLAADGDAPWICRISTGRPGLVGLDFTATPPELKRAADRSGRPLERIDAPGGGRCVRLSGPGGLFVRLVADRAARPATPRPRRPDGPRINQPLRLPVRPPSIRRLGHVALEVVDLEGAIDWFGHHLGLIPSDVQVLPDGAPAVVFLRCDLGSEPADHHTVVLARSIRDGLNHAAFEVDDLDAVAMGQTVMRAGGWNHAWGVGRHVSGSQIFDYWRDPWGGMFEHYADGDLFDADHPPGVMPFGRTAQAQWGPPMPRDFVDVRLRPRSIWRVLRAMRRTPIATLRRTLAMRQALTAKQPEESP